VQSRGSAFSDVLPYAIFLEMAFQRPEYVEMRCAWLWMKHLAEQVPQNWTGAVTQLLCSQLGRCRSGEAVDVVFRLLNFHLFPENRMFALRPAALALRHPCFRALYFCACDSHIHNAVDSNGTALLKKLLIRLNAAKDEKGVDCTDYDFISMHLDEMVVGFKTDLEKCLWKEKTTKFSTRVVEIGSLLDSKWKQEILTAILDLYSGMSPGDGDKDYQRRPIPVYIKDLLISIAADICPQLDCSELLKRLWGFSWDIGIGSSRLHRLAAQSHKGKCKESCSVAGTDARPFTSWQQWSL